MRSHDMAVANSTVNLKNARFCQAKKQLFFGLTVTALFQVHMSKGVQSPAFKAHQLFFTQGDLLV